MLIQDHSQTIADNPKQPPPPHPFFIHGPRSNWERYVLIVIKVIFLIAIEWYVLVIYIRGECIVLQGNRVSKNNEFQKRIYNEKDFLPIN